MDERKKYWLLEFAKTFLWICGFFALAYLVKSPLFKGKSQNPAATNPASEGVYLEEGKDNSRVKELSREYKPITLRSLSDFFYYTPEPGESPDPEMAPKSKIPDEIKALNGRKIAINGFMMPIDQNVEGSKESVLNGNVDMCGFGGPIAINQGIVVKYTGSG